MITKKELGYVNLWSNRVPYPGINYCEEVMDKVVRCFELYNQKYRNVKYNISFSNNEEIELEILPKNICHMLGIDYSNITSEFFSKLRQNILNIDGNVSSYDLITRIIENKDMVLEHDANNKVRFLNYYKVSIKCDIFNKLVDLSHFNYGCINFDKNKLYKLYPENRLSSRAVKFLYTPSDETISPYFLMGLKTDGDFNQYDLENYSEPLYIVETMLLPNNYIPFFHDQEVVIPTQVLVDNGGILEKKVATAEDKIKLLKDYKSTIAQAGIPDRMNIYNDYLSLLMNEDRAKAKVKVK